MSRLLKKKKDQKVGLSKILKGDIIKEGYKENLSRIKSKMRINSSRMNCLLEKKN